MIDENHLLQNDYARRIYQHLRRNKGKTYKISELAFICGMNETQVRYTLQRLVHWYPNKIVCNCQRPLSFKWEDK